jgi:N-acetylglucosamine-6-phosphate deacetylase
MSLAIRGRIVAPDEVLDDGWLAVEDGRVAGLGRGRPPASSVDLSGSWVLPGFIDLHVHGGGGYTVTSGDVDAAARVATFHLAHGTTRMLASLVTAPADRTLAATSNLASWVRSDRFGDGMPHPVAGLHLEGPFLSQAWCGAQDPRWMVEPDAELLAELVAAGRGYVRVVTVAPERPEALELIRQLGRAGVVAAIGHTDATYGQAMEAFAAGASLVTHLCNGMRPPHHREPGVLGAAFDHSGVSCEIILDGAHLHPAMARMIVRNMGPSRLALISDAIEAAGMGDGRYDLGGRTVDVRDGIARLASKGSLAGSTLTMDAAVRYAVTELGLPVTDVSRMASRVPARLLGLEGSSGMLAVGADADVVVLDEAWQVTAVIRGGRVAYGAERIGVERL